MAGAGAGSAGMGTGTRDTSTSLEPGVPIEKRSVAGFDLTKELLNAFLGPGDDWADLVRRTWRSRRLALEMERGSGAGAGDAGAGSCAWADSATTCV